MGRSVWLTLAVAVNVTVATISHAQTNSWIDPSDGKWEKAHHWDNGSPSDAQSAVIISNANSKVVTIDAHTARNFPNSLTISNLTVSAQDGNTNTLFLENSGTVALHILNNLTIGFFPDFSSFGASELISINSTLVVDGLLGGQLEDSGTMVITGGSLLTTNCSLQVAYGAAGLLIISNAFVQARDVGIATGTPSIGTVELIGGTMTLSSSLVVGAGQIGSQGSFLVVNGNLVITNGPTNIGDGDGGYGIMTLTNSTMLASSMGLGGGRGSGNLSIEASSVKLEGGLTLDYGYVYLNGGMLVVTNAPTTLGEFTGFGEITVGDGLFLAREIFVGTEYQEDARLTVYGGSTQLSSNLQIGAFGLSAGGVFVGGGQLVVTNGEIMAKPGGSIAVEGGLLAANSITIDDYGFGEGIYNPITDALSVTGTLAINGGSVTAFTGITLGDCASSFVGQIAMDGGQLIVTNTAGTGFIDVQKGQLVLSDGVLQVDKLVMTNSCGSLVHTGGTLIVGSVILDPNTFRIVSVTPQGNDMLVTWMMGPGATNILQAAAGGTQGSYTTNGFADIFVVTNNTTPGTFTNYLDIGAATNKPSRYYRARLSP